MIYTILSSYLVIFYAMICFQLRQFHLVSQREFVAAMSGFLSTRFSLFISELTPEIRSDDWLSFVPGSVAEGVRRLSSKREERDQQTLDSQTEDDYQVYALSDLTIVFYL